MNPTIGEVTDQFIIGDQEQRPSVDFVPALAGMGMEKTVTVFNPMPADFRVKYTRSIASGGKLNDNLKFTKEKTGMDLGKQGGGTGHASHTLVLKSKSAMNLPGDIAQIAVQKLINTIIQIRNEDGSYQFDGRGGRKGMVPDPHLRKEIEDEIVRKIMDTTSYLNPQSQTEFTNTQIAELNLGDNDEPTQSIPDPAPGTGVSYTPKPAVPTSPGESAGEKQPTPTDPAPRPKPTRGRPKAKKS